MREKDTQYNISEEVVRKIAKLAKLQLKEDEIKQYTEQFQRIFEYFKKLNSIDTENTEPFYSFFYLQNVLREDQQKEGLTQQEALMNAPSTLGEFFKIPKII